MSDNTIFNYQPTGKLFVTAEFQHVPWQLLKTNYVYVIISSVTLMNLNCESLDLFNLKSYELLSIVPFVATSTILILVNKFLSDTIQVRVK